jgi:hypothetical protein
VLVPYAHVPPAAVHVGGSVMAQQACPRRKPSKLLYIGAVLSRPHHLLGNQSRCIVFNQRALPLLGASLVHYY